MLRHFITTIDYAKLIEIQANTPCGSLKKENFKSVNKSNKVKKIRFNSVKRHK